VIDGIPSLAPADESTDVKRFFDEVAKRSGHQLSYVPFESPQFDRQLRLLSDAFIRALSRWVQPGSTLLDVGCGHGGLLAPAARRYRMVGIDFAFEMLPTARERGYEVYHGDAASLPFAEAQFDAVICAEVLQHFPDPRPILQELVRVCRPGGSVIISTLNAQSLVRALARSLSRISKGADFPLPIIRRTARDVAQLMDGLPVTVSAVAWVLSPSGAVVFGKNVGALVAPLATNFILCLSKDSR